LHCCDQCRILQNMFIRLCSEARAGSPRVPVAPARLLPGSGVRR
jgi:hypothetical protein